MTLNFLTKIHEERRLSMSHWRFRLLHWCFFENNPKTKHESGLPNFLYEHYCPLFHLTNFIAIFSPLIFLFRVTASVAIGLWTVLAVPVLDIVEAYLDKRQVEAYKKKNAQLATKEYQVAQFRSAVLEYLKNRRISFDYVFEYYGGDLTEEEAKEVYDSIVQMYEDAKARREELKKRRYDRMVFWSNIGKIFVGWLMYVFYAALFVASLYAAVTLVQPIINLVKFIFSTDYSWVLPALFVAGKLFLLFIVTTSVIYVILRAQSMQPVRTGLKSCALPVGLACQIITSVVKLPVICCRAVVDFISVFYAENCPPIVLVYEDEATIEEMVCNS